MSWFADLASLDLGLSRMFIYTYQEALAEFGEDPSLVFAAIDPANSSSVCSAFFRDLVRDNGHSYRLEGFFGSLPSNTRNHQPDLIPADVIKESYWRWMEWASRNEPASWTDLRELVLRKAVDPRVLRPFGEMLQEAMHNVEHKALRQEEAAALTEEDRWRILDIYLSQAYRER